MVAFEKSNWSLSMKFADKRVTAHRTPVWPMSQFVYEQHCAFQGDCLVQARWGRAILSSLLLVSHVLHSVVLPVPPKPILCTRVNWGHELHIVCGHADRKLCPSVHGYTVLSGYTCGQSIERFGCQSQQMKQTTQTGRPAMAEMPG